MVKQTERNEECTNKYLVSNKPFLENVVFFFEKYTKLIIIIFLIIGFIMPFVIFSIYVLISLNFKNPISADGLLGYAGAVLISISTLIVSIVALYESKKRYEMENEDAELNRRKQIRPEIEIKLERVKNEEYFILTISNISQSIARKIHFFDLRLCSSLLPKSEKVFKVSFGKDKGLAPDVKVTDEFDLCSDERYGLYPEYILISLLDVDGNCIFYDYIINENGECELEYTPYCS